MPSSKVVPGSCCSMAAPGDPATDQAPRPVRQLPAARVPLSITSGQRRRAASGLLEGAWPTDSLSTGKRLPSAHFRMLSGRWMSPAPHNSALSLNSLVYLTSQHVSKLLSVPVLLWSLGIQCWAKQVKSCL